MLKVALVFIVLFAGVGAGFFLLNQSSNPLTEIIKSESKKANENSTLNYNPIECSGKPIKEQPEGPFYIPNTPERNNIVEVESGDPLILEGFVLDSDCNPIANAWIDFWQADAKGNYDSEGYNLRGYQYTDENGFYFLITILPAQYPGRTEHIHFKIRKNDESPIITSQLYFPNSTGNSTDSIFNESLLVNLEQETEDEYSAQYNIIIP